MVATARIAGARVTPLLRMLLFASGECEVSSVYGVSRLHAPKVPLFVRGSGPRSFSDPSESATQTASRSVQSFLQSSRS